MIVIDIDHFKKVNDSSGHHAGDLVLKHVSQTLKDTLRETDQVFRFGGEEFVIVLSNANTAAAERVAERARKLVETTSVSINNCNLGVSISLGVSTFSAEDDRDSLFQRADEALYLAKKSGRNCVKTEWDLLKDNNTARA